MHHNTPTDERPLMPAIAYRAAWVFPVVGPPLRNGVIDVDDRGQIAGLRTGRDGDAVDLGNVALVPALVNAHVHLEFSDLGEPIGPALPFPGWVKNVVAHRRARTTPVETIFQRGLDEVARNGTAAVGEIATSEPECYPSGGPEIIPFRELIGPLPEQWPRLAELTERQLLRAQKGLCPPFGLSPHAPYTVPQELFEWAIETAVRYAAPVAVHLAETASERELFADGTGELVEMLRSLGLWRPELHPQGRRPLDWLKKLASVKRGLLIHGNYLDGEELDFIAAHRNLTLVYCPRTHAYFKHPPHPFRKVLERGGRVALGTDGRSSNPDLDLWREAASLRDRHPDLKSDTILDLATRSGAEALGIADRHGVLAPGRRANFLAVRLAKAKGGEPPDLFAKGNEVASIFHKGIELTKR